MSTVSMSAHAKPKQAVPDEAALKAKVAEVYRAHQANDEKALRALVLPQLVECGFLHDPESDDGEVDEKPPRVISWRIKEIRPDMNGLANDSEVCPGKPVHATAGALVFVEQTDQEGDEKPTTGMLVQPWAYVNGVWYWLVDND